MELNTHVFGALCLQETRRPIPIIGDFRIGRIMADKDVMLAANATTFSKNVTSATAAVGLFG